MTWAAWGGGKLRAARKAAESSSLKPYTNPSATSAARPAPTITWPPSSSPCMLLVPVRARLVLIVVLDQIMEYFTRCVKGIRLTK